MISLLSNVFIVVFLTTFYFTDGKDSLSDRERGFTAPEMDCGGQFDLKNTALIEGRFLPDNTSFYKECIWRIKVTWGYQIAITFNSLDTDNKFDCSSNYVAVRDSNFGDGTLMGRFCNNRTLPKMRTVNDGIYLKFVSSDPNRSSSFSATVQKVYDDCVDNWRIINNKFVLSDEWHPENICGKTFSPNETKGTITSPCYPGYYPPNRSCVWKIFAPAGVRINLKFKKADFASTDQNENGVCEKAYVEVSSMQENEVWKKHGIFCRPTLPDSILSEGNVMKISFRSASIYNIENFGFVAEFSHIP